MAEERPEANDPTLNQGLPDHRGLDDAGRQRLVDALAPRTDHPVGNFADLQRMGAAVVEGSGSLEEAVATPPNVDPDTANFPGDTKNSEVLSDLAADAKQDEKNADK